MGGEPLVFASLQTHLRPFCSGMRESNGDVRQDVVVSGSSGIVRIEAVRVQGGRLTKVLAMAGMRQNAHDQSDGRSYIYQEIDDKPATGKL
jgi:hypothetical protein